MGIMDLNSRIRQMALEAKTPSEMRSVAAMLRAQAERLERLADASERDMQKPNKQRMSPTTKRPQGRQGGDYISIRRDGNKIVFCIGKALWRTLGCWQRLNIQALDGKIYVSEAIGDEGWRMVIGQSIPRATVDSARDLLAHHNDGRYAVKIVPLGVGNAIVLEEQLS